MRSKVASLWQETAFRGWNAIVFVLLLNAGLSLIFRAADAYRVSRENIFGQQYNPLAAARLKLYPGMSQEELKDLLQESFTLPLIYEPFTGFTEKTHKGKYLNISEDGYRMGKSQGPWPPQKDKNLVVFVFGGSTTFSYGVPDDITLPSRIQDMLQRAAARPVAVYNFGRGYYYSTQERILYQQLLSHGFVPDIAIFIDGINDFYHTQMELAYKPPLSDRTWRQEDQNIRVLARDVINSTALARLATAIRNRLPGHANLDVDPDSIFAAGPLPEEDAPLPDNQRDSINAVVERYFRNKAMIEGASEAFGIRPVFVWQPTPLYKYDLSQHLFKN